MDDMVSEGNDGVKVTFLVSTRSRTTWITVIAHRKRQSCVRNRSPSTPGMRTTGPSALRLRPPLVPPATGGTAWTGMPLASTAIMGCCCGLVSAAAMPWIDRGSGHVPGYSPAREE